jgi:hypothetical protein
MAATGFRMPAEKSLYNFCSEAGTILPPVREPVRDPGLGKTGTVLVVGVLFPHVVPPPVRGLWVVRDTEEPPVAALVLVFGMCILFAILLSGSFPEGRFEKENIITKGIRAKAAILQVSETGTGSTTSRW